MASATFLWRCGERTAGRAGWMMGSYSPPCEREQRGWMRGSGYTGSFHVKSNLPGCTALALLTSMSTRGL